MHSRLVLTQMREKADRVRELEDKYEQAMRERAELEAAQKRAEELQQRLSQEVGLEQEQRRRMVRCASLGLCSPPLVPELLNHSYH